jgi:hypothetical protein
LRTISIREMTNGDGKSPNAGQYPQNGKLAVST